MENEKVDYLINMINDMDIKDKLRLAICMSQSKWSGLIYNTKENYEKLLSRMIELGLNPEEYKNYLETRKYGATIHSGFGLGFERFVMYLTGISNIRDVEYCPRTVGSIN